MRPSSVRDGLPKGARWRISATRAQSWPAGAQLSDHGVDLPADFPALARSQLSPNLPAQPNPLIGRESEVAHMRVLGETRCGC